MKNSFLLLALMLSVNVLASKPKIKKDLYQFPTAGLRSASGTRSSGLVVTLPLGKVNFSYQYALNPTLNLEEPRFLYLTFLGELRARLKNRENANFIFGMGGHTGRKIVKSSEGTVRKIDTSGYDLKLGIEFHFEVCPVVVAFDITPHYDFDLDQKSFVEAGISLRYRFGN